MSLQLSVPVTDFLNNLRYLPRKGAPKDYVAIDDNQEIKFTRKIKKRKMPFCLQKMTILFLNGLATKYIVQFTILIQGNKTCTVSTFQRFNFSTSA